jgi:hypothetical protein
MRADQANFRPWRGGPGVGGRVGLGFGGLGAPVMPRVAVRSGQAAVPRVRAPGPSPPHSVSSEEQSSEREESMQHGASEERRHWASEGSDYSMHGASDMSEDEGDASGEDSGVDEMSTQQADHVGVGLGNPRVTRVAIEYGTIDLTGVHAPAPVPAAVARAPARVPAAFPPPMARARPTGNVDSATKNDDFLNRLSYWRMWDESLETCKHKCFLSLPHDGDRDRFLEGYKLRRAYVERCPSDQEKHQFLLDKLRHSPHEEPAPGPMGEVRMYKYPSGILVKELPDRCSQTKWCSKCFQAMFGVRARKIQLRIRCIDG